MTSTATPKRDFVPGVRTLTIGNRRVEPEGPSWAVHNPATEETLEIGRAHV